mgnify:FL=1
MAKNKNTGLGRGLDAIFLDNTTEESGRGVTMLRLSDIEPRPDQPRKQFESESLASLADSIAENGVLQPLLVRAEGDGFYQIIAGERRWRASKMAGLTEVPAIITDADDKKAFELAIIENIQRENLNAIEEAAAIRDLMTEYGLTQEEVSTRISRSRSAVSNAIRLLDLPDSVMKTVSDGKLSAGHARALLGLRDSEKIISAAQTVISRGLSVRATEELVRSLNRAQEDAKKPPRAESEADRYMNWLCRKMSDSLERGVRIVGGKKKHIELEYRDSDDLERMIRKLCGEDFFDGTDDGPEQSGNV